MIENESKPQAGDTAPADAKSRRETMGRLLTLAAAAPMAALLFNPGKASASGIPP